jgi:protein-S-isoprenylcysteine O-methyltransferase Ste14
VTAHPVSGRASVPATVAVAILASAAIFAVAYAVGGCSATEDNWVGFLGVVSLLGGLVASLAAFALALAAKIEHEQRALLWLPFSLFPALLAFVVLGELLWWE